MIKRTPLLIFCSCSSSRAAPHWNRILFEMFTERDRVRECGSKNRGWVGLLVFKRVFIICCVNDNNVYWKKESMSERLSEWVRLESMYIEKRCDRNCFYYYHYYYSIIICTTWFPFHSKKGSTQSILCTYFIIFNYDNDIITKNPIS